MTTAERFWSKVEKREDGCWIWMAACWVHGYGAFTPGRKTVRAHRFAWELTHGPIPPGLVVMHKCDVKACVNPAHLQLGTQAENRLDCVEKGRHARGVNNGNAKLDPEKAREIRNSPLTLEKVAARYGVGMSTASRVRRGVSWSDESERTN